MPCFGDKNCYFIEGSKVFEARNTQEFLWWSANGEVFEKPGCAHSAGSYVQFCAGTQEKVSDLSGGRAGSAAAKQPIVRVEVLEDSAYRSLPGDPDGNDSGPALPDDYLNVVVAGVQVGDANTEEFSGGEPRAEPECEEGDRVPSSSGCSLRSRPTVERGDLMG